MKMPKLELLENLNMEELKAEIAKGGVVTESRLFEIEAERGHLFWLRPNLTLWTGTGIKCKGADAEITENGKTWKCKIPEKDGFYEPDEHGLPFGKPAKSDSKTGRKFWRVKEYEGFLVRGYDFGGYRRGVDAGGRPDGVRFGVLVER